MSKDAEVRRLLWTLIKGHMPVFDTGQCYEAIVHAVEKDEMTCEVSPLKNDDLTITARLTSAIDGLPESYFQVFPTIGSTVLVQAINDDPDDLVVHTVREVEEVRFRVGKMTFSSTADGHVFNDGDLGGLTNTPELKKQLDIMSGRIDTIEKAIKNATVVPSDGGATFKANMIVILEAYTQKEQFSSIENKSVTHG